MAQLQPNDEFLVNRNDVTYTQPTETLMAKLENDDYLLINREDVTYKITGEDIYDSLVDPLELTVTLDITNPAPDETITAIASASGGKQPYTPITYQWKKRDQALNITDLTGETSSTFLVTADLAAFELACECTVEDSLANSVTTLSAFTSPVTFKEEVDTPELLTPPDGAGMGLGFNPESGFIISAETEGPTATMHGLRFDKARETYLTSSLSINQPWTVSVWVKLTSLASAIVIGANGGNVVYWDGTNWRVAEVAIPGSTAKLNEWQHIVATGNATHVNLWLDGVKITTGDGASNNRALTREGWWIGANHTDYALSNSIILNGYLSDVYAAEQELEPETFGAYFDGTWGPLDSTEVKANIAANVQAPVAPNYTEKWSDNVTQTGTWVAGRPASNIFSGALDNSNADVPGVNGGSSGTLVFDPPITGTLIEINGATVSNLVTINGDDSNKIILTDNGFTGTEWVDTNVTSLSRLDFVSTSTYASYIRAIRVDGRILIDGPADNSQVWSDGGGHLTGGSWTSVFDGDTPNPLISSNGAYLANNDSSPSVLTFSTAISGELRVWASTAYATGSTFITLNTGESVEVTGGTDAPDWYNFGTVSNVTSMTLGSPSNVDGIVLGAVELEGKLLIDGVPEWNTSQVWSEYGDTNNMERPWTASFNGIEGPAATESNQRMAFPKSNFTSKVDFTSLPGGGISYNTLRVQVARDSAAPDLFVNDNDLNVTVVDSTTNGGAYEFEWKTISGPGLLINLGHRKRTAGSQGGSGFAVIEVDGEILVDKGSFGTNGFFLPFDPEATGGNYTSNITGGPFESDRQPTNAFDGNPGGNSGFGYAAPQTTGFPPSSDWITIPFDPPLEDVTKFAVFSYDSSEGRNTYEIDTSDGIFTQGNAAASSKPGYTVIREADAFIVNSLRFKSTDAVNFSSVLYGVEVNGKTLFNHNSIGVDDSGNGNNFQDENFLVKVDNSKNRAGDVIDGTSPDLLFDGKINTGSTNSANGTTSTINFPGGYTVSQRVEIYSPNTPDTGISINTNGGSFVDYTATGWVDLNFTGNLTSISWKNTSGGRSALTGVKIDGKLLGNPGVGQDTVTDTPMSNYAVLTGEAFTLNGGLETNTNQKIYNSTVGIPSNSKIYWEVTIKKVRGLESNPIAGVHGIAPDGKRADQAGGAGFYLTSSGNNGGIFVNGVKTDTDLIANSGDLIGLAFDYDTRVLQMYKNGVAWDSLTATDIDLSVVKVAEYMNLDGQSALNFGQQPFAASNVTHNQAAGTVEIDGVTYKTLNEPAVVKATLQLADAGTLDSIEGNPTMTAKVGGAKGTYESHTSNELVLTDVSGTWEVASEKAVSDVEYTVAAINPNSFVMTSSEFEATPSDVTHGASTWQVTEVNDYFYANPAIDVTSSTELESLTTGGLEEDTVYRARVKHTSANGVDSLWSEQRHQNVFKTELLPVTVPDADMKGLRFDSDRETFLNRGQVDGNRRVYTVSFWYKPTNLSSNSRFLDAPGAPGGYPQTSFHLRADGTFRFNNALNGSSFKNAITENAALILNKWHHIMLVVNLPGAEKCAIYVDGQKLTLTADTLADEDTYVNTSEQTLAIANTNNASFLDGYLSDYFFVDGQALEPEAFGALFPSDPNAVDRRWGPLDSDVVKANIETAKSTDFPDDQYDTSQVWSNRVISTNGFSETKPLANMFDGESSSSWAETNVSNANQSIIVNFAPALTGVNTLKVYCSTSDGQVSRTVAINGGTATVMPESAPAGRPSEFVVTNPPATVSSIQFDQIPSVASDFALTVAAIEVNGKILVDAGFGANGFFLPFDPAATGGNYTNNSVSTGDWKPTSVHSYLFDGNFSNPAAVVGGSVDDKVGIVTFTPALDDVSTVEVLMGNDGKQKAAINAESYVTITADFFEPNLIYSGTPISLSSVKFVSNNGTGAAVYGIRVNGKLLVDHNSIGVDDSGNDNHFHDENFAVGNTDEVWSSMISLYGGLGTVNPGGGITRIFDGSLNTIGKVEGSNDTYGFVFTVPAGFTNKSLEVHTTGHATIPPAHSINGTTVLTDTNPAKRWIPVGNVSTGDTYSITRTLTTAGSCSLFAIKLDGKILVDKNIQDTVTDTPMRNYAVLESGLNGNLEISDSSAVSTLTASSGKYYFEVTSGTTITNVSTEGIDAGITTQSTAQGPTGNSYIYNFGDGRVYGPSGEITQFADSKEAGTIIGTTFDLDSETIKWFKNGSLLGSTSISDYSGQPVRVTSGRAADYTINFGQQPFAASNVTYDQAAGTVEIAPRYNSNQQWEANFSAGGPGLITISNPLDAFNGDLTSAAVGVPPTGNTDSGYFLQLDETFTNVTSLRIQVKGTSYNDLGTHSISGTGITTVSGISVGKEGFKSFVNVPVTSSTISDIRITCTDSSSPMLAAMEINGSLLVDSSLWNTSQNWSDNTTSQELFFASSPVTNAFDGDNTTFAQTLNNAGNGILIDLSSAGLSGDVEVYCTAKQGVYINGDASTGTISDQGAVNGLVTHTWSNPGAVTSIFIDEAISPSPTVYSVKVGGKILVDGGGGTFNTLYQTWDEYATFGAFFYNERTDEIIQAFTLKRRYGLLGAKPEAGIYDLSVQPNFAVAAYIKEDNVYVPIEDPAPRIAAAEAQAAAEVAAAQAEVRKYQRMLIRAACGWVVAKAYTAGDIIIYNGHVFRALEDNVATADNDPGDLDGTWEFLGLEEDAAPLAIDGYFPLYETEEVSNAAGNGSSHAHTFDGVTYYMPDGGVTIYHGDYTGFDY